MLIARHISESPDENSVSVAETPSGWILSANGETKAWTFEFDATLVVDRPDVAFLYLDRLEMPVLVWGSEIFHDRAATASALSRKRVAPGESSLAVFAIEEDGTHHCFVNTANAFVNGLPCDVCDSSAIAIEVLADKVPSLRSSLRRASEKGRLLSRVCYADSMAALEGQIDLLTSIVLHLVDRLPESDQPTIAVLLGEVVKSFGVATLHDNKKLIGDIAAHKSKMRSIQVEYFTQRDKAI